LFPPTHLLFADDLSHLLFADDLSLTSTDHNKLYEKEKKLRRQ
jgi:hypothetical protein